MDTEKPLGLGRPPSRNRSKNKSWSRSVSLTWNMEEVFGGGGGGSGSQVRRAPSHAEEDEEALKWAALEKLPTYARLRTSIMKSFMDSGGHENMTSNNTNVNKVVHKEVDVRKLDVNDRQQFIDRLFRVAEEDNEKFLQKFRNRIDK